MIYVDNYKLNRRIRNVHGSWSHLIIVPHPYMSQSRTERRLTDFAERLGLKPEWVQNPGTFNVHFDVNEGKRQKAISLGAIPVSVKQAARLRLNFKKERKAATRKKNA